jgi:hypothetical protein
MAVLSLTTDLAIPQQIDSIRIELVDPDVPSLVRWSQNDELGPNGLTLPTRVALQSAYNVSDLRIRYHVKVWQGTSAVLFADAIVELPTSGNVLVDQPLELACYGQTIMDASGGVRSSCPDGQACRAGVCAAVDRTRENFPVLSDSTEPIDAGIADAQ